MAAAEVRRRFALNPAATRHFSAARPAVTQVNRYRIVRMPGNDKHATLCLAPAKSQSYVTARDKPHLLRRCRANHCRVVPGEPRYGLGSFLQPAVIGVFTVANRRIGSKHNFHCAGICGGRGRRLLGKVRAQRQRDRGQSCASYHAIVQRCFPESFKRLALLRTLALPVSLEQDRAPICRHRSSAAREFREPSALRIMARSAAE